jgi:pimeloyl-ACP methyl ester carboxylesterase
MAAARHTVLLPQEGYDIEVTVDGNAGMPLVMLPSSLRDAGDFDAAAALLAHGGFRVLRPWPRGMGRSTGPLEGLSLTVLAADVIRTIEVLGGGAPAILVGHAFGHFVARVADLEHPEWVGGIVVVAGAARTFPEGMAHSLKIASDPEYADEERIAHLRHAFFAPGNDEARWLRGWYPGLRAAYSAASAIPDKSTWWPVSRSPILDLQAADDPWRPPASRTELKEVLGEKVTIRVIEGASHALLVERPESVAESIIDWAGSLRCGGQTGTASR